MGASFPRGTAGSCWQRELADGLAGAVWCGTDWQYRTPDDLFQLVPAFRWAGRAAGSCWQRELALGGLSHVVWCGTDWPHGTFNRFDSNGTNFPPGELLATGVGAEPWDRVPLVVCRAAFLSHGITRRMDQMGASKREGGVHYRPDVLHAC